MSALTTSRAGAPEVATTTAHRAFGGLVILLAALLVLNTALGPLVTGVIDYDLAPSLENQLVGLELVTVLLVVPVTVWAGLLSLRGRVAGPLLAIGPAAYSAYSFVQYVLGPEYDHYSVVVLLHTGIASLAGALTLWAWALSGTRPLPGMSSRQRRARGLLLLGFAAFVLLRYAGAVGGAWSQEPITAEFAEARTFYWSIFLMDLGLVVPATVVAAVACLRGAAQGERAVYAVLGWFALVPPSVAVMAMVMVARDDPHGSLATVGLLSVAALVFAAVSVVVFRPLLRL
jgi:hypothetical protein